MALSPRLLIIITLAPPASHTYPVPCFPFSPSVPNSHYHTDSLSLFVIWLNFHAFPISGQGFAMERIMTHVGGGGGSSVGSVASTVSREEVVVVEDQQSSNSNMGISSDEVSSYPDEAELQFGLGLSLSVGGTGGGGNEQQRARILTAKDLPSMGLRALKASPPSAASSSASSSFVGDGGKGNYHASCVAGTKRAAETSPTGVSQVVGWPPISAYRVNSLVNQAKTVAMGGLNSNIGENKVSGVVCSTGGDKGKENHNSGGHPRGSLFVKVNMDGIGIGRKVDLSAHSSYETLAQTLEEMFTIPTKSNTSISNRGECDMPKAKRSSKLLGGVSDFVLTYEDKDGDWMLVGDVPWGLFLGSVKKLRIVKTSEANGLESWNEERTYKQRSRPI